MDDLRNLKIISLILFIISIFGILGTLIISNILVSYKITFYNYPFQYTNIEPVFCDEKNNFCKDYEILFNTRSEKLGECRKASYRIDVHNAVECKNCEGKRIPAKEFFNSFFDSDQFIGSLEEENYLRFNKLGGENDWEKFLNNGCILNSNLNNYYTYAPFFFNKFTKITDKIKKNTKYSSGHTTAILPYIFGETSISNIAKRFPANYFFKTFMIISSFLILVYWRSYNKLFQKIKNEKKINIFYISGVLSGIFLFLHVIFLGSNIEILYFEKIKRLILILFIFFEIFAQANLVINLYTFYEKIKNNIDTFYLELKKYLIIIILIVFIVGLSIFILIDFGPKFNNIVEWNFFTFLIFFYLFSYFMWSNKKCYNIF